MTHTMKPGRKNTQPLFRTNFMILPEQSTILDIIAEKQITSRSDIVRKAINEYVDKYYKKVLHKDI